MDLDSNFEQKSGVRQAILGALKCYREEMGNKIRKQSCINDFLLKKSSHNSTQS